MRASLAKFSPQRVLRARPVRDYAMITAGAVVTAFALQAFLIPNRLSAGGLSGLATVIHYFARDRGVAAPVGAQMLAMNVALFAIAIRMRGWRYTARTLYGAFALAVAIDLMSPWVGNLAPHDNLLAVLYGGALAGIGLGLVFRANGSTGGTDIVAQLVSDKTSLGPGQVLLVADAVVQVIAALYFGPELALYGFVAVFITGSVIDLVLEGPSIHKAAYIISEHSERIAYAILNEMERGATGLAGRGLWSGEGREVIFTVVTRREVARLKELVDAIDPHAFVIISDVHEVLGEGFSKDRSVA